MAKFRLVDLKLRIPRIKPIKLNKGVTIKIIKRVIWRNSGNTGAKRRDGNIKYLVIIGTKLTIPKTNEAMAFPSREDLNCFVSWFNIFIY